MTDTTPSPTPASDEELSAAIDGELGPAEAAAIHADPADLARLGELTAAVARVGEPVAPLDDEAVDRLLAVAMGALDDEDGDDSALSPVARRSRRSSAPPPWLVAAVIVVLVAVGLTLVWRGRNTTTTATDTAASLSSSEKASADDRATTEEGAGDSAKGDVADGAGSESHSVDTGAATSTIPPALAAITPIDLGTFTDGAALRKALATSFTPASAQLADGSTGAAPATESISRCANQLQVTLSLDEAPTQVGYAKVAGAPVLVYEFETASYKDAKPTTLVAAVGTAACDQVVIFQR